MKQPIIRLRVNGKQIILVGTVHVSSHSIALVKKTIALEKPDCVAVELDSHRLEQVRNNTKWQQTDLRQVIKQGKTYVFLLNLLMANLQRKMGDSLGIQPGSELLQAVVAAEKKKVHVELVDRDVTITMKRAFAKMSILEKLKLWYAVTTGLFGSEEAVDAEQIQQLQEEDILTKLLHELGEHLPSMKEVIVDERDTYIAQKIKDCPGKKILAVVGAGHLKGLAKKIKNPRRSDLALLEQIPRKVSVAAMITYAVPLAFMFLIGYAFYAKGFSVALNFIWLWFLVHGTLSAAGALLSKAHPVSILTAFISSPFTSLHPAIAAGWFAALTELRYKSPKVADFHALSKLDSLKQLYTNGVTHILIVAAFTNIGSTIGTIIAFPYLMVLIA